MTLEDRVKQAFGEYMFRVVALETQCEQFQAQLVEAQAKIAEIEAKLKPEKPAASDAKPKTN